MAATVDAGASYYLGNNQVETPDFASAVYGAGGNTLEIFGVARGGMFGVRTIGFREGYGDTTTIIGSSGYLSGYKAGYALINGGDTIFNEGTIFGQGAGISSESGYRGVFKNLDNMGLIASGAGNYFGINAAIYTEASDEERSHLDNSGRIKAGRADGHAILYAGNSHDTVLNSGTISGLVDLGAGNDLLDSRRGHLTQAVTGGDGNDQLLGSVDDNLLAGGTGNDLLRAFAGDDRLRGGPGNDRITGGAGEDAFIFDIAPSATSNLDVIGDFRAEDDTIWLTRAAFPALSAGALPAGALADWDAPDEADDRILYRHLDSADADLAKDQLRFFYDADGGSTANAVHFATLSWQASVTLSADDFIVV